MRRAPARLLIIAGSDSSGGAGLQADIKTACVFGVYATTAVTAITVQDTMNVHAVYPVSAPVVREQIACCLSDIGADAIKIGMLGSLSTVESVAEILERTARNIPLVLDPVLASTGGTPLLEDGAIAILKERLFPLAALVTPNIPEAVALTGMPVHDVNTMRSAAEELRASGASAVLVKGGHGSGNTIEDVLACDRSARVFSSPRIESRNTHGTGCTLATAIACGLAQGLPLVDSVERARGFVQKAIHTAPGFGLGRGPLNYFCSPPHAVIQQGKPIA